MRRVAKLALTGFGIAAIAGAAIAAERDAHVLNVVLPDGSVEQIHYVGKVPPRIVIAPDMPARLVALPVGADSGMDPFAFFDRMTAEMDAHADAMLRQAMAVGTVPGAPGAGLTPAALGALPPGTVSYSYTSYSSGAGGCSQSVQMTSFGQGQPPKVVRQESGDCRAAGAPATPAVARQPAAPVPGLTPAIAPSPLAHPVPVLTPVRYVPAPSARATPRTAI